jgi:hypothetical protein
MTVDNLAALQVAHADAEGAALALSAIAPDGVTLFRTECLELGPEPPKQLER